MREMRVNLLLNPLPTAVSIEVIMLMSFLNMDLDWLDVGSGVCPGMDPRVRRVGD